MKVIHKGGIIRKTCKECGCVFEFTKEEVRVDYTDKPKIDCPECGSEIYVNIKR
jgi:RNase P subunit RPR2